MTRLIALTSRAMGSGKSVAASRLVDEHGFRLVKFAGPLKDMTRALLTLNGAGDVEEYVEGSLKEEPIDHLATWLRVRGPSAVLAMLRGLAPHVGINGRHFDRHLLSERDTLLPGLGDITLQRLIDTLFDWLKVVAPRHDTPVTARRIMQTLGTEWGRQMLREDIWTTIAYERSAFHINGEARVVIDDMRFANELDTVRRLGGLPVRIVRPSAQVTGGAHASEGELDAIEMREVVNDGTIAALHKKIDALALGNESL